MKNFWEKLRDEKKPFFVLAPMADVTDAAFRQMLVKYGKPDVTYTEFVSANGLCSVGREALMERLKFQESERPIVAQIFGAKPEHFFESAKLIAELGFDGVDINMGCPDRAVLKQGAGSSLIQTPELAREIIRATKNGIKESGKKIPVSVKTRIGFYRNELETWIGEILAEKPDALIVHGRTRKQIFGGQADWESINQAAKMAQEAGVVFVGNGDVKSREDGIEKAKACGADGVMIGRAFFGNPWLLGKKNADEISTEEKLNVLIENLKLIMQHDPQHKFYDLKKHIAMYVRGFDGAKELRAKLIEAGSVEGVEEIVKSAII